MTEPATASTTELGPTEPPIAATEQDQDRESVRRHHRWPYLVVFLAIVWIVIVRVPLILNARNHLDSDLAVDGITLRDALQGHWRWHYPATPQIGILPIFYSLPQALIWGANPFTLVSGGTVAFVGLVLATFALTWVSFGRSVAAWGLVPLTFASTGVIWLSGRITGGHLSAVSWHAIAFLLLYLTLARGQLKYAIMLGVWCGLGLYVDTMFMLTLSGLVPAAIGTWWRTGRSRRGLLAALVFIPAFMLGVAPREIGARVDPHSSYPQGFLSSFEPVVLLNHLRLLGLDCLPRLITGHRLPNLQSDPSPAELGGPGPNNSPRDTRPLAIAVTVIVAVMFLAAVRALADPESTRGNPPAAAVRWGMLISGVATLVAFVIYRDIFNADNYRYLVILLVPWSIGFGLAMHSLVRMGRVGLTIAVLCGATLAGLMTLDTGRWYHQFGWINSQGRPVQVDVNDPLLAWLNDHPEVDSFLTGYWDAYRLTFLANRSVLGIPYPIYPNRFPEWSRALPSGHPQIVINRHHQRGGAFADRVRLSGGQYLMRSDSFDIITWP
ncbi:hypothetical protein V5E97_32700 [Singulisphaera sp. Ch08]|uniref:Glycosyltransferase RgtA/B/C/D-like domain-containing protein n=1 Tax=Singulisphaera sp. Ch08 TaxID=3120278 RepID=A0AAU7CD19_9BACT